MRHRLWPRLRRGDKLALGVFGVLLVLALVGDRVWVLAGPRAAYVHSHQPDAAEAAVHVDPWGRPCRQVRGMCISAGPDGVDQSGRGDDLIAQHNWRELVLWAWNDLGLVFPFLFLWAWVALQGPRHPRPVVEVARALAATAPLVCFAVGAAWLPFGSRFQDLAGLAPALVVPPQVAVFGTLTLLFAFPALLIRFRHPVRTVPEPPPLPTCRDESEPDLRHPSPVSDSSQLQG
ncbi:hypothetical protein OAX78_02165 [Planctomycetota bacterium]|nr:hypothetical protein [Planctomycetota bacterium]